MKSKEYRSIPIVIRFSKKKKYRVDEPTYCPIISRPSAVLTQQTTPYNPPFPRASLYLHNIEVRTRICKLNVREILCGQNIIILFLIKFFYLIEINVNTEILNQ